MQSSQLYFVWLLGWEDPTARDLRGSTVWLSKPWFHQRATRADVLIKNAGSVSEGDCRFQAEPGRRFKALNPLTCKGSQVSMPSRPLKNVATTNINELFQWCDTISSYSLYFTVQKRVTTVSVLKLKCKLSLFVWRLSTVSGFLVATLQNSVGCTCWTSHLVTEVKRDKDFCIFSKKKESADEYRHTGFWGFMNKSLMTALDSPPFPAGTDTEPDTINMKLQSTKNWCSTP